MKRSALALAALAALALPLAAQVVTKVGICDFTKVLNSTYRESKAYRDYDAALAAYTQDAAAAVKEITDLENQKLDADKAGNKDLVLSLDKKIAERRANLDYYRRVRGAALQQQADKLLTGPVLQGIMDVIRFIRESQGFALIIRSDGPGKGLILDNINEVDVTDDVIKELLNRAGKTSSGTGGQ